MAVLNLKANKICAVSLNGNFLGILYPDSALTLPFPERDCFFSAIPQEKEYRQASYFISSKKLLPSFGRLCRWSEDIYELFFIFEKENILPPPVILKEASWRRGILGLCGGYVVFESGSGCKYYNAPVDDFSILSEEMIVVKQSNRVAVLNSDFEEIFTRENCQDFYTENGNLFLSFTPGDMDFFLIKQVFNKKLVSSEIVKSDCASSFDFLRMFCQSLRLNLNCDKFISPSLKTEMDINSIKDFLGVFDQTDNPKYLNAQGENTIALRYMVDEYNFHYICYEFKLIKDSEKYLVDDIFEI